MAIQGVGGAGASGAYDEPVEEVQVGLTDEELAQLLRAPKKTTGDEGQVEERSADDLRKLANFTQSQCKPPFGMCIARVAPRGTVG